MVPVSMRQKDSGNFAGFNAGRSLDLKLKEKMKATNDEKKMRWKTLAEEPLLARDVSESTFHASIINIDKDDYLQ